MDSWKDGKKDYIIYKDLCNAAKTTRQPMPETSRSRAILAAAIEASEFEISMRMLVIEKFET